MPAIRAPIDTPTDNNKRPQQQERKDPITRHSHNETHSSAATLLARVEAHPLSAPGDPFAFECRLADDNGWTLGHAVRVVREYRRFLVLTQVAGEPVCPSDDVDQAWHLHITRTADYERFCREVLGRFLHHHPAGSGSDEHQRHRAMYSDTLSQYRRAFATQPPADVWPATDKRFAPPQRPRALIALPGPFAHEIFLAVVVGAFVILFAMGLDLLGALDSTHAISGPRFLLAAVPFTIALVILATLSTSPLEPGRPRDTLDAYEAAWLAGGTPRLVATAIAMLVDRGALVLQRSETGTGWRRTAANRLVVAPARPDDLHPVELACLAGARRGVLEFERANQAMAPTAHRIGERLRRARLAGDGATITPARLAMVLLTATWLVVALERIPHALGTPRPMDFLVLLTLATAATLLGLILRRRATWRGRKALAELTRMLDRRRLRPGKPTTEPISAALLPMTLALLGPAAVLAQPLFLGLDDAIGSTACARRAARTARRAATGVVAAAAADVGMAVAADNGDHRTVPQARPEPRTTMDTDIAARSQPTTTTTTSATELLGRIEAFGLSAADDPLGFESRLADDHGWTLGHALAVADEYRRFLVLTQLAGHPVSPPPDVDEAWHLHLTRTVDYEAMCRNVLGRFLHHEPARASGGDAARYRTMYADTLKAYLHVFDRRPPEAIWPDVDQRRVATPAITTWPSWTVPANLRRGHRLGIVAIILAASCGWLAQAIGIGSVFSAIPGPTFIGLAVCAMPLLAWLAWQGGASTREPSVRDVLDPYEAAWLSGGAQRMTSTAIATLVERGVLLTRHAGVVSTSPPIGINMTRAAEGLHPVEQACLSAVADDGLRPRAACLAVEPVAWACEQRLIAAGIATAESALPLPRALALLGLTLLLAIEIAALSAAFGTPRPVGLLVVLAIPCAALMLVVAHRLRRSTDRAEASLKRLRSSNGAARKGAREGAALSYAVALMGGYALTADPRFTGLGRILDAGPVVGLRDRSALRGSDGGGGADCSSCGGLSACGSFDGGGTDVGDAGGSSCSSCSGGGGSD